MFLSYYYLIPTYHRSEDGVKRTERIPAADKYRDIIILQLLYLYIYYIYKYNYRFNLKLTYNYIPLQLINL